MKCNRLSLLFTLGLILPAAAGFSAVAYAQDTLTGTYTGSFTISRGPKTFEAGMELIISAVEQSSVKGTAKVFTGQRAGTYAMEGNYENNKLSMKGAGGPCPFGFSAKREGNKLVGTTGAGAPLQLSK